jgi:hypothetical protein
MQERRDSYWILLLLEHRCLRLNFQSKLHQQSEGDSTNDFANDNESGGWIKESKEQVTTLLDEAANTLDQVFE